jgi:predicted NBD/HSP70 family sugar kinase
MAHMRKAAGPKKNVLVIDVGGTHVKVIDREHQEPVKIVSGPVMTAAGMVKAVKAATRGWKYDVVTIGYPGPVENGKPMLEPFNLGGGWVRRDFGKDFGCPVRIINDAAMQALGSYEGGRMLYLGLGTGLGSALIVNGELAPMELAHLPYRKGKTFEDYVGLRGLGRLGKAKWRVHVARVIEILRHALMTEDVVLGGGNAKFLKELPKDVRLGSNANAFRGGFRVWEK